MLLIKKCTIRVTRAIGIRAENANLNTWGFHDKVNLKSAEKQRSLTGAGVTSAAWSRERHEIASQYKFLLAFGGIITPRLFGYTLQTLPNVGLRHGSRNICLVELIS